jgi:excinuclease UvrABC helicase subunit UvrB
MLEKYLNHFFGRNSADNSSGDTSSNNSTPINDDIIGKPIIIDINNIPDDLPQPIKEAFEKIKSLSILGKLDDLDPIQLDKVISEELNESLGEPSEEQTIKKDGLIIERKIWDLNEKEKFVKVSKSEAEKHAKRTIEVVGNELEDAIEVQDFILAAKLRDEMRAMQGLENEPTKRKSKK